MPQNKPTAKLESNGTMTFEPLKPGAQGPVDMSKPEPHAEVLVPPLRKDEKARPQIVPVDPLDRLFADPGIVRPGQYQRPSYTDLKKT
jgi:hypothetical protein